MAETFKIYTFGKLNILQDGQPITGFNSRKSEVLVVYLACTRKSYLRETLAELLWEERSQTQSMANLRLVLSDLRQHVGSMLAITRQTVSLELSVPIWLDVTELDARLNLMNEQWTQTGSLTQSAITQLEQTLALYQGDFLAGVNIRQSRVLEEWISFERERLQQRVVEALQRIVQSSLECGMYMTGVAQAKRLLEFDPLDEEAHRQLMLLLWKAGQRPAALAQYETCARLLLRELNAEPDEKTVALYEEIWAGEEITVSTQKSTNPYKGLRAFQEADAPDFFGRDALTERLLSRLRAHDDHAHFLAVIGPSGSGKSSVVKAGLIPALRCGGLPGYGQWLIAEMTPGTQPLKELEAALNHIAPGLPLNLLAAVSQDKRGLLNITRHILPDDNSQMMLVIDQFEELFMQVHDDRLRTFFLDCLITALSEADTRLWIVVTLRADFYDRPLTYARFGAVMRNRTEVVLPMTSTELEQAILGPAERVGASFEKGLVLAIASDIGDQPGTLPLLQYALTELYERRQGSTLTFEAYHASGGVIEALARRADELYLGLTADSKRMVHQVFLRLVTPGEGTEDTRRRVLRSELVSLAKDSRSIDAILDIYGKYRLLTFDHEPVTKQPTVEVAHEALIRVWKRLRYWLDENRDAIRVQRQFLTAAAEWNNAGRDASFLASGTRLAQFETLTAETGLILSQQETEYLHFSLVERDRKQAEEAERRTRELSLQRRATRRLGYLVAVLATFLIVGVALLIAAVAERNRANQQSQIILSRQLAAQSITYLQNRFDLALLLSLESARQMDTVETTGSILTNLEYTPALATFLPGHTSTVTSVAFSPDGKLLASASVDGSVRLWNIQTAKPVGQPMKGHSGTVWSVAFSPDGKNLASGGKDGTIRFWDVATGDPIGQPIAASSDWIYIVAFSPDGKTLASGSRDKTIRLWDVKSQQAIGQPLTNHTGPIRTLQFSPDGKLLASGSEDKTILLWDVATRQPVGQPLTGHTDILWSVAFSPDGKTLASGSADKTIRLWNVADGKPIGPPLIGHTDVVNSVTFSPDGSKLASGSTDATILLWDLTSDQLIGQPLTSYAGVVYSVAFSPDGKMLASGSQDKLIRLWNVDATQRLSKTLLGHTSNVLSVAFSPDGKTLASGGYDTAIRLWNVATDQPIGQPLTGHSDWVTSVVFSPDGQMLASSSADKTIRLWNPVTGDPIGKPLTGHTDIVWTLAFSPDGKKLASGGFEHVIRLWDVATGQPIGLPLTGHSDWITSLAFSPDGKLLASGSADGSIRLWDAITGQPIGKPLTGHTDWITSIAFSPDGKTLASSSRDLSIILWDVASGKAIGQPLTGHQSSVISVAFSPDGKTLASGSADKTIRLWDVATGQPIGLPLTGHTDWVVSVAFSPDGKTIASGSWDSTIRLWDVSLASWKQRICQIANRNLTLEEWQQYMGSQDYQKTCPQF